MWEKVLTRQPTLCWGAVPEFTIGGAGTSGTAAKKKNYTVPRRRWREADELIGKVRKEGGREE